MPSNGTKKFDGQIARSLNSLEALVGWNSVAIFKAGEHRDENRRKVNKATVFVALADPCPEYTTVVYIDGEHHHTGNLLSSEYEGVFKKHLNDYGKATVVPLSEVEFIRRDERGIPRYTGTDANGGDRDE